jgi:hypothetical protein
VLRHYATGGPLPPIYLISARGTALWTGVVLVVFVQVLPEANRRAATRALEDYEAALRERAAKRDSRSTDEALQQPPNSS